MAAIPERHGIYAGIRIGERGQCQLAPGLALVLGPHFKNLALLGPADGLKPFVLVNQNGRLDRADLFAIVDRSDQFPGLPQVSRSLEMNTPAAVFGAARAQDVSAGQLHGLVLYRTED